MKINQIINEYTEKKWVGPDEVVDVDDIVVDDELRALMDVSDEVLFHEYAEAEANGELYYFGTNIRVKD